MAVPGHSLPRRRLHLARRDLHRVARRRHGDRARRHDYAPRRGPDQPRRDLHQLAAPTVLAESLSQAGTPVLPAVPPSPQVPVLDDLGAVDVVPPGAPVPRLQPPGMDRPRGHHPHLRDRLRDAAPRPRQGAAHRHGRHRSPRVVAPDLPGDRGAAVPRRAGVLGRRAAPCLPRGSRRRPPNHRRRLERKRPRARGSPVERLDRRHPGVHPEPHRCRRLVLDAAGDNRRDRRGQPGHLLQRLPRALLFPDSAGRLRPRPLGAALVRARLRDRGSRHLPRRLHLLSAARPP